MHRAPMAGDWTDSQNDAIVADYFAMLTDDIIARPYSKAEHNRLNRERLNCGRRWRRMWR